MIGRDGLTDEEFVTLRRAALAKLRWARAAEHFWFGFPLALMAESSGVPLLVLAIVRHDRVSVHDWSYGAAITVWLIGSVGHALFGFIGRRRRREAAVQSAIKAHLRDRAEQAARSDREAALQAEAAGAARRRVAEAAARRQRELELQDQSRSAARIANGAVLAAAHEVAVEVDTAEWGGSLVPDDTERVTVSTPVATSRHAWATETPGAAGLQHLVDGRRAYVRARSEVTSAAFRCRVPSTEWSNDDCRAKALETVWAALDAGVSFPEILGAWLVGAPASDVTQLQEWLSEVLSRHPNRPAAATMVVRAGAARRS